MWEITVPLGKKIVMWKLTRKIMIQNTDFDESLGNAVAEKYIIVDLS